MSLCARSVGRPPLRVVSYTIRNEFGNLIDVDEVRCGICGALLMKVYTSGSGVRVSKEGSCKHFTVAMIKNGCLENPEDNVCRGVEKLIEKAVYVTQEGNGCISRGSKDLGSSVFQLHAHAANSS
ncbi:MAG: hypothetical protein GXO32_03330 [Crenarchaeota archaeon]|nr:hypothetical protein [Thermoproteota archaeon]